MHIKPALKYQLADSKNSILIFYIIILFVIVLSLSLSLKGINVKYNGIEIATVIFLFVFGMNSFKETFLLFMQNSISRKTMFVSL